MRKHFFKLKFEGFIYGMMFIESKIVDPEENQ